MTRISIKSENEFKMVGQYMPYLGAKECGTRIPRFKSRVNNSSTIEFPHINFKGKNVFNNLKQEMLFIFSLSIKVSTLQKVKMEIVRKPLSILLSRK